MKTAEVERQIKWTGDSAQAGCIVDGEFRLYAALVEFLAGELDGARRKIHAGDLPTGARQRNEVRAGAAAEINGAPGRVSLDKFG